MIAFRGPGSIRPTGPAMSRQRSVLTVATGVPESDRAAGRPPAARPGPSRAAADRPGRRARSASGSAGGSGTLAGRRSRRAARPVSSSRLPASAGRRHRHRGDQRLRVGVLRALDHVDRRPLLDDPAQVHDRDPVAQRPREAEVVGDEHQRQVAPPLQLEQDREDLGAHRGVEHRDRLVADQPLRLEHSAAAIATRWRWPPESWCG